MVQGQRAVRVLRHRAAGRKAGEAHRGRSGRLLRAVPVRFTRAVRNLDPAPAAQPSFRTAEARRESTATGSAGGQGIATAGENLHFVPSGGAHGAEYTEQ